MERPDGYSVLSAELRPPEAMASLYPGAPICPLTTLLRLCLLCHRHWTFLQKSDFTFSQSFTTEVTLDGEQPPEKPQPQ